MPLSKTNSAIVGLTALFSAFASSTLADEITTFVKGGAAIGGTDPVAYFTQGKPVKGKNTFTAQYDDVTWKFASAENRDLFVANPKKYAPQYGGFCAFGTSMGYKVPVVPEAWKIVNGKLYLNNSLGVQKRFLADEKNIIKTANSNWKKIKDIHPDKL